MGVCGWPVSGVLRGPLGALWAGCALALRGVGPGGGRLGRPGGDLLSHVLRRSTIGAEGFHGRVRDGIGCLTPRQNHQVVEDAGSRGARVVCDEVRRAAVWPPWRRGKPEACRCALDRIKPNERLVPVGFTHCCASTPGLSTWWSTTALQGELVLRGVSRLDAFSGYPVRT